MRPRSPHVGPSTLGDQSPPTSPDAQRQRDDGVRRHRAPRFLVGAYVGFATVLVVVSVIATPLAQGVVVAIAGAVGGGTTVYATRRYQPSDRLPWHLLGVGTVLVALPRSLEQLTRHQLVPGEALQLGNALGMLGFAFVVVGPVLLARARSGSHDRDGLIDGTILTLALATALQQWLLSIRSDTFMAVPAAALGVMTIVSATALAAGIRLVFLAPRIRSAWLVAFACLAAVLIGVAAVASAGREVADAVFVLATVASLANGLAALQPSMRALTTPVDQLDVAPFSRLAVLGVALFAPLVAVLNEAGVAVHTSFAAASSLAVTALVIVRILRLVTDRERVRRALDSREAQQSLVARLGEQALGEQHMDRLFEQVIADLPVTVSVDTAAVLSLDIATSSLHVITALGWPTEVPTTLTAPPDLLVADTGQPRNAVEWDLPHVGAGRTVAFSLTARGRVAGVLAVCRDDARPFTTDERTCLQSVASVLSGSMQRSRSEAEIRHQALHDMLTGLPNRILLLERLQAALDLMRRAGDELGVLFIDLDGFKNVNDTLGHQAGDQLLIQVAQRLRALLRPDHTLSRISGDEFVIVCANANAAEVERVARMIISTFDSPFALSAGTATVGASVGVVVASCDQTPEELLQSADTAMYRSKRTRGTSIYTLFDERLRADTERVRDIERSVPSAARRGQLHLAWQPIVSASDGRDVGAEALARWTHPVLGTVRPEEFIPIAERMGAVGSVGSWVLGQACQHIARWRTIAGDDFVGFVNISTRQLADPQFVDDVLDSIRSAGLPSYALGLEVTETAAVYDLQRASVALDELRLHGIRTALDDFGSGHSSLAYLQQLPADIVKVDRDLIRHVVDGSASEAVVASIVAIANALGLLVIAEGVETLRERVAVRRLGCDMAQGFHFARPMGPEAFAQRLRGQATWHTSAPRSIAPLSG